MIESISLIDIQDLEFSYFDLNGNVYTFSITKNKIKLLNDNELEVYLLCNETNISSNSEIFFILKENNNKFSFRTNYFANSSTYTNLNYQKDKSTSTKKLFNVSFKQDTLELILTLK